MATMLSQKLVEAQEANDTVRDFSDIFLNEKQARSISSPEGCSASSVIKCFTAKNMGSLIAKLPIASHHHFSPVHKMKGHLPVRPNNHLLNDNSINAFSNNLRQRHTPYLFLDLEPEVT